MRRREWSPGKYFLHDAQKGQGGGEPKDVQVQVFRKNSKVISPPFEDLRRKGTKWKKYLGR